MSGLRAWTLSGLLSGSAVLVCMARVDRPVADWVQAAIRPTPLFDWIMRGFGPLRAVAAIPIGFLLVAGLWAIAERLPPPWTRTPLLASWSGVWALAATVVFKEIFGRSSPYPEYLMQHVYGYHLPQSVHSYAFPSGATTVTTALLSVLWIRIPRGRGLYLGILVVIGLSLILSNNHWVSDVIAGAFLGTSIGWMTERLGRPEMLR